MTRKRAIKLLMSCGIGRNAAKNTLDHKDWFGYMENAPLVYAIFDEGPIGFEIVKRAKGPDDISQSIYCF